MRVLTIGTFAIPHLGHAAFLRACEQFGSLTVGVNSDGFVVENRGQPAPFTEEERMALIASLGYRTVLNDGPGRKLIEVEEPDILVIGTDWARRDYYAQIDVDQDFMDLRGITMVYLPMRPVGISSTEIARRCSTTS